MRPERTLTDWLSDMRRAHAALPGEDIQIDRMLAPATLEGLRDRALLSVLLYHGLRREELCLLTVRDIHARRGVPHLRVHGTGGKTRYLPLHPGSAERIDAYLEAAGHGGEPAAPLFQPANRRQGATRGAAITADDVYNCVLAYAAQPKIAIDGFGVHSLRATAATAATNAREHEADLAKVQERLGHANIATTRIYDRRKSRPEKIRRRLKWHIDSNGAAAAKKRRTDRHARGAVERDPRSQALAGEPMKDEIAPTRPLNETEIDQLDDFLTSDSAPDAAMDVSMMDGFMTALASGPNLMMPGTMLGWIWDAEHGQDLPTFASADESKRIVGLIIRHWNSVNDMLNDASAGYEPLILEHESDGRVISVIDDWCEGYYKGIAVDRTAWAPVLAEHPEWFTVIMLYGTEEGWDELKRRKDNLDQHQAFAGSLARSVQDVHRYWAEQRRLQIERGGIPGVMAQREPLRRAPKVGRNDPCPCGSGKKYKRCHGVVEVATGSGSTGHGFDPEQARRVLTDAQESLIVSPLSQRVTRDGTAVEVEIYGDGNGAWLLEVVDEFGNSTVWDDSFPTDRAALAEALNVIDGEGIAAVIGSPPASATRH